MKNLNNQNNSHLGLRAIITAAAFVICVVRAAQASKH